MRVPQPELRQHPPPARREGVGAAAVPRGIGARAGSITVTASAGPWACLSARARARLGEAAAGDQEAAAAGAGRLGRHRHGSPASRGGRARGSAPPRKAYVARLERRTETPRAHDRRHHRRDDRCRSPSSSPSSTSSAWRSTCSAARTRKTGWQRVFGGQVVAQALVAATRTVPERPAGRIRCTPISCSPGDPRAPIVYEVERIRDGRSFTTRRVKAIQHGRAIFATSASYQVAEDGPRRTSRRCRTVPGPEALLDGKALAAAGRAPACPRRSPPISAASARSSCGRSTCDRYIARRRRARRRAGLQRLAARGLGACRTIRPSTGRCSPTPPT